MEKMQLNKRASSFVVNQTLEVILAVAVVVILAFLIFKLLSPNFESGLETSNSYMENLIKQVGISDLGKEGKFSIWQEVKEHKFFIVYFGDKVVVDYLDKRFTYLGSNENLICVCYTKNNGEGVCEVCEGLKRPAFLDGNSERWVIEEMKNFNINKEGESYLFSYEK